MGKSDAKMGSHLDNIFHGLLKVGTYSLKTFLKIFYHLKLSDRFPYHFNSTFQLDRNNSTLSTEPKLNKALNTWRNGFYCFSWFKLSFTILQKCMLSTLSNYLGRLLHTHTTPPLGSRCSFSRSLTVPFPGSEERLAASSANRWPSHFFPGL